MGAYDRRSILLGGVGLAGAAAVAGELTGCTKAQEDLPPEPPRTDGAPAVEMGIGEVVPILAAIADRLVPPDELGPGAKAAGAERYFEGVLADPRMKNIKSIVTRGAVWVNRAARKENNVSFFDLTDAQKDDLIARLADNKVRPNGFSPVAFIRVVMAITLEAFLGHPKHGGNKDEVGWNTVGGIDWSVRKLPVLSSSKTGGVK